MAKGIRADGSRSPLLGRCRPQEVIDKISVSWTEERKRAWSKAHSGAGNPCFGRQRPEEEKQRISEATKANMTPEVRAHLSTLGKAKVGALNPSWKGGRWIYWIYPAVFEAVKYSVRQRDNHTCQRCGATSNHTSSYALDVHHIDGN